MDKVYISKVRTHEHIWKIKGSTKGIVEIDRVFSDFDQDPNEITLQAAEQLSMYFVNIRSELDFPLDLRGTPFQLQVWEALREIPYGCTATYGQIAARIGKPKASRAVGQAVGRNPCLIAVPCHRVLGGDGSLTGFSSGLDLKRYLLRLEGITFLERG